MRRLVQTSAGWMALDLMWMTRSAGGLNVTVALFGVDGWQSAMGRWSERNDEGESLADVIEALPLPRTEAELIATQTLEEWRASGREQESKDSAPNPALLLAGTFGLAAIGAAALVAAAIWLATKLF